MSSSTPVIQYLRLDSNYDPVFDPSAALTDVYAVQQTILTRLSLFLGEWWEDTTIGLPVFQKILGQLATKQGLAGMTLAVQQNIAGAPYVTGVQDTSVAFTNGRLSITASVTTTFGVIAINTSPALSASGLEF